MSKSSLDRNRRRRRRALHATVIGAATIVGAGATDAAAQESDRAASSGASASAAIEEVVVTARNRTERAQDVPVPITVIGGDDIDRARAFTIADLTQRAPGLTATTPNARLACPPAPFPL